MFQDMNEVADCTYKAGSNDVDELAEGSSSSKCVVSGTLIIGNINLTEIIHVQNFNITLLSVGDIWDQDETVVFTNNQAVIVALAKLKYKDSGIDAIIARNNTTGLYQSDSCSFYRASALTARPSTDINLRHRKLIHTNVKVRSSLHKNAEDYPFSMVILNHVTTVTWESRLENNSNQI